MRGYEGKKVVREYPEVGKKDFNQTAQPKLSFFPRNSKIN